MTETVNTGPPSAFELPVKKPRASVPGPHNPPGSDTSHLSNTAYILGNPGVQPNDVRLGWQPNLTS